MKGKIFKRALFGYSKKSVDTYFAKSIEKMNAEIADKNAQIADLRGQLKKHSSSPIAIQTQAPDVIIENAKKRAEAIVNNGTKSLTLKKAKLQEQIKEEKIKLKLLQAEVKGLKKQAIEATSKFTIELEPLLNETSA